MGEEDSEGGGITDDIPDDAESTLSPENKLQNANDEELLREYYNTVMHLGICEAEGQIDTTEKNWEGVLFQEILSRMDEDYEPTY
jgi:hypothetical protein